MKPPTVIIALIIAFLHLSTAHADRKYLPCEKLYKGLNGEWGNDQEQRQMMESIVQADDSGADLLRLSANMQTSEEFRQDMRKAVNQILRGHPNNAIRSQGSLVGNRGDRAPKSNPLATAQAVAGSRLSRQTPP